MTAPDGVAHTDAEVLRKLYSEYFSEVVSEITRLQGDASDRVILRLRGKQHNAIGIIGPNRDENRAFIGFARTFHDHGLSVPQIYHVSGEGRCYLEEDFGDITLSRWQELRREGRTVSAEIHAMYARVLEQLQRFQVDAAEAVDYSLCYQYKRFAEEAMAFDLLYFHDMFLQPIVQLSWDEQKLQSDNARLITFLCQAKQEHFLYRDFQSRNVMIHGGEPCFIDFQSGRRGALHYDVASLLFDSKGDLPAEARDALLAHYLDVLETRMPVDRVRFRYLFEGFAVLRLMQALGAFGNIGLNKGRPQYLELIPSRLHSLAEVVRDAACMHELPYLRALLLDIAEHPDSCSIPSRNP